MSQKAIRSLLETRLKTWATARAPALPIAFQNAGFTKPATGAYLRCYLLPNPTDSAYLEATDRIYLGVFQVSIVAPLNGGPAVAEGIVIELEALFPKDLEIAGTPKVRVLTQPSAAPALDEPDANVVPVSFSYRATTY